MANFRYLLQSANLIPASTLTPTSEDETYPIENVQSEPVATAYRTEDCTLEKILIEFDEAVTADLFALVNHTLTDAATITLRGGSSSDPDGNDFEVEIPWANRNAWKVFDDSEEWRYWSVIIADPTNPAGVFDIGLMVLGESVVMSRNFNLGSETRYETVNQVLESEYGVTNVGPNLFQRARFVASWKTGTHQERRDLNAFLLRLQRERSGMFFIPDPSETEVYYGRLVTDHAVARTFPLVSSIESLEFLEDSVGRAIFA